MAARPGLDAAQAARGIYIGVMTGTSMDGLDACAVDFSNEQPRVIAHHAIDLGDLRPQLRALALGDYQALGSDPIDLLGQADQKLADRISDGILQLLQNHQLDPAQIVAIGSHGQTVRHRPETDPRFTLQIGDPNRIAERCAIPVIADLRRRDMAAGGQAAPLVPPAHRALFGPVAENERLIVVNLGGISNITVLSGNEGPLGFDTGPANTLMDAWIERYQQEPFDRDGAWAASGNADTSLLQSLLQEPYFAQPAPKSTGLEQFNLGWLNRLGGDRVGQLPPADVQATLLKLTVTTLIDAVQPWLTDERKVRLVLAGGGALNGHLCHEIQLAIDAIRPDISVRTSGEVGIEPQCVECAAFAWLARQFMLGLPGNAPSVTGARGPRILGGYYPS